MDRREDPFVDRREDRLVDRQDLEDVDLAFATLLAIMHREEQDHVDLQEVRDLSCPAILDRRADPDLVASSPALVL